MNFLKKYFWIAVIICGTVLSAKDADVRASLEPQKIESGEISNLVLTTTGAANPEILNLPEIPGIEWIGRSMRHNSSWINGKLTSDISSAYSFVVLKPGEYTIPPLKVRIGKDITNLPEMKFKAVPKLISTQTARQELRPSQRTRGSRKQTAQNRREVTAEQAVYAKFLLPDHKKEYFAGEEIPVEIDVIVMDGIRLQGLMYPAIRAEGGQTLLFRDYSDVNPKNPNFAPETKKQIEIDGVYYTVYRFQTMLRAIETGELNLSTKTIAEIAEQGRFPADDPFFDSFFDSPFSTRTIRRDMTAEAPEPIRIKPLPKFTVKDAHYLGLIGNWKFSYSVSAEDTTVGNGITLKLNFTGNGDTAALHAPELTIPGFRVYQPEISRGPYGGNAEVRYLLIPTHEGTLPFNLQFAWFNPETGKYQIAPVSGKIKAGKAEKILVADNGPGVADYSGTDHEKPVLEKKKTGPAGILYLKKGPYRGVSLQFWRNSVASWIFLVLAGLLIFVIGTLAGRYFEAKKKDGGSSRRSNAAKAKKNLLHELRGLPPEKCSEKAFQMAGYLNDALNLPPGTSLDEIAEAVQGKDPELAGLLREVAAGAWSPLGSGFTAEKRDLLIRKLGKLACVLFCFLTFTVFADTADSAARDAYDKGDYAKALTYYESELRTSAPSPELLYNIGNCLYQEGKYGPAIGFYERARRLAPRDNDIEVNLNLARQKLNLRRKYTLETPGDVPEYLCGLLRPDEWITLTCFGIFLVFLSFGIFYRNWKKLALSAASAGTLIILLGIGASFWQFMHTYAEGTACITEENTAVMERPSDNAARLPLTLHPGDEVRILDERGSWMRVRCENGTEGWIAGKDLYRLL